MDMKPIPGFPGYFATQGGNIYSNRRKKGGILRKLKPYLDKNGYFIVSLFVDKKQRTMPVHRLVLLAFVGKCPPGMECCHHDGNCQNNRASNLRWDTRLNNNKDKIRHGNSTRGEKHPLAKLKEADVFEIKRLLKNGVYQKEIGAMFGVVIQTISAIKNRKSWAWL